MRKCFSGVLVCAVATAVAAAPPGPIDGQNIPGDFASGTLLATQSNTTGFGNQTSTVGGFTPGSEADELYVANDDTFLYVGITGNVQTNGNAYLILIDADNSGATGQNELKTQGVDGDPCTLQNVGQPTTDCTTYGTGTLLPTGFGADYAVAVDTFGGTMYTSEYTLSSTAVGTYTCDGPGGINSCTDVVSGSPAPVYATRAYVGSTVTNDNNDVIEGTTGLGYIGGFNNTNVDGVTAVSAASAASANTGLEIGIPLARLGVTAGPSTVIKVLVLIVSGGGTGPNGTVHNQSLPSTSSANCASATALGLQPDLSGDTFVMHSVTAGNPATSPLDGQDQAGTFGVGALKATQACPTSAGDQAPDPTLIIYSAGSELDQLFAASDGGYVYLGITGNIETSGNAVLVYIDSKPGGERIITGQGGGAVGGMNGDALPLAVDGSVVDYDYAYNINAGGSGTGGPIYVDLHDLQADSATYIGSGTEGSADMTLSGGSNPNCAQLGWNRGNVDGVIGCGDFEPGCSTETIAAIEAQAATATMGFELAIPLADIGVTSLPATIRLWAFVSSGGGYGSNQGLPPLRTALSPDMKSNAGDGPTDFTFPAFPSTNLAFDARAASVAIAAPVLVNIASANPPLDNPYAAGTQPFRDVLAPGPGATVTQGIGAAGTPAQDTVIYGTISVTFSGTPSIAPSPCNVAIACSGGTCPTVTSVSGSGAGPYLIGLSGAIPILNCTSLGFAGTNLGQKISYISASGNISTTGTTISGATSILQLVNAINNGQAAIPSNLPRYNINRVSTVGPTDVLRIVALMNGSNAPATFGGAPINTACP